MSDTLFFNPSKSAAILVDAGIPEKIAFEHLVRLKNSEFAMQFSGTTYFDPRELRRIIHQAGI